MNTMLLRTVIAALAALCFFTSVVHAQGTNYFTINLYSTDGCTSLKSTTTVVSGTCSSAILGGNYNYVKAYMGNTNQFQYFVYSDSSCSVLVGAESGACDVCTASKHSVTCPTAYAPATPAPLWPTVQDGFVQRTACFDASCSGATCVISAAKANACFSSSSESMPAARAESYSCSLLGSLGSLYNQIYSDTSCTNVIAQEVTSVQSCASESTPTAQYKVFRKYNCVADNKAIERIAPKGIEVTFYNASKSSTCSDSSVRRVTLGNDVCIASSTKGFYQTLSCGDGILTASLFTDSKCAFPRNTQSTPLAASCAIGSDGATSITSCNQATSVMASMASIFMVMVAIIAQRLF